MDNIYDKIRNIDKDNILTPYLPAEFGGAARAGPGPGGPSPGGPSPGGPSLGGPSPSGPSSGGPSPGGPSPSGPSPAELNSTDHGQPDALVEVTIQAVKLLSLPPAPKALCETLGRAVIRANEKKLRQDPTIEPDDTVTIGGWKIVRDPQSGTCRATEPPVNSVCQHKLIIELIKTIEKVLNSWNPIVVESTNFWREFVIIVIRLMLCEDRDTVLCGLAFANTLANLNPPELPEPLLQSLVHVLLSAFPHPILESSTGAIPLATYMALLRPIALTFFRGTSIPYYTLLEGILTKTDILADRIECKIYLEFLDYLAPLLDHAELFLGLHLDLLLPILLDNISLDDKIVEAKINLLTRTINKIATPFWVEWIAEILTKFFWIYVERPKLRPTIAAAVSRLRQLHCSNSLPDSRMTVSEVIDRLSEVPATGPASEYFLLAFG